MPFIKNNSILIQVLDIIFPQNSTFLEYSMMVIFWAADTFYHKLLIKGPQTMRDLLSIFYAKRYWRAKKWPSQNILEMLNFVEK